MSVNVIEKVFEESERKFPMLMFAKHFEKNQIILATGMDSEERHYIGTNINGVGHPTGYHGQWCGTSFKPFHGSVIIESAPKEIY